MVVLVYTTNNEEQIKNKIARASTTLNTCIDFSKTQGQLTSHSVVQFGRNLISSKNLNVTPY